MFSDKKIIFRFFQKLNYFIKNKFLGGNKKSNKKFTWRERATIRDRKNNQTKIFEKRLYDSTDLQHNLTYCKLHIITPKLIHY